MGFPFGKMFSGVLKVLPHIGTAVAAVEAIKGIASGSEKRAAAIDLAQLTISTIEGNIEADILEEQEVEEVMGELIDVTVKVANVINRVKARRAMGAMAERRKTDTPR
jgi:hypothetical protein